MTPELIIASQEFLLQKQYFLEEYPEYEDDDQILNDTLDGENDFQDRLRELYRSSLNDEAEAVGLMELLKKLQFRLARKIDASERKRKIVFNAMQAVNLMKLASPDFKLAIVAGQQFVIITNENELPEKFIKVEKTPLKNEIKKALKDGEIVSGAILSNGAPYLRAAI